MRSGRRWVWVLLCVHLVVFLMLSRLLWVETHPFAQAPSKSTTAAITHPKANLITSTAHDEDSLESHTLKVSVFSSDDCSGDEVIRFYSGHTERKCQECWDFCNERYPSTQAKVHQRVNSIRVDASMGSERVRMVTQCSGTYDYPSISSVLTITASDGCVDLSDLQVSHLDFIDRQIAQGVDLNEPTPPTLSLPLKKNDFVGDFMVVYNVEAKDYFRWQVRANYFAFLKSKQSKATYMRLLSNDFHDDISQHVPTFVSPKHQFAGSYSPLNKPHSIDKWLNSIDPPKEEILLIIDPDNWLIRDVSPYLSQVRKGYAVAQSAWFYGSREVDEIWRIVCESNCESSNTDHVAVPILIHTSDMRQIAPLWTYYTVKVRKLMRKDESFRERFKHTQATGWSVEMIGYVYAAAHVGVKHKIESRFQLRDVDARPSPSVLEQIPMIHMGRAWFPADYEPGKIWWHTEGKDFSRFGQQVWCKCNHTAGDIVPWPLPEGVDFITYHTLTLLHDSIETWGDLY